MPSRTGEMDFIGVVTDSNASIRISDDPAGGGRCSSDHSPGGPVINPLAASPIVPGSSSVRFGAGGAVSCGSPLVSLDFGGSVFDRLATTTRSPTITGNNKEGSPGTGHEGGGLRDPSHDCVSWKDFVRFSGSSREDGRWDTLVIDETMELEHNSGYIPIWLKVLHHKITTRFPSSTAPILVFAVAGCWVVFTLAMFVAFLYFPKSWLAFPMLFASLLTVMGGYYSWHYESDRGLVWTLRIVLVAIPTLYHMLFGFTASGGMIVLVPLIQLLSSPPQHDTANIPGIRAVAFAIAAAAVLTEPILNLSSEGFSPLVSSLRTSPSSLVIIRLCQLFCLTFNTFALFFTRTVWLHTRLMPSCSPRTAFARASAVINKAGVILSCNVHFSDLFGSSMLHRNLFMFIKEKNTQLHKYLANPYGFMGLRTFLIAMDLKSETYLMVVRVFMYSSDVFVIDVNDVTDGIDFSVDRIILSNVLETVGEGLVVVNKDMEIQASNGTAQQLFRQDATELVAKKLSSLATPIGEANGAVDSDPKEKRPSAPVSQSVMFRRRSISATGVSYSLRECQVLSGEKMFVATLEKVVDNPVALKCTVMTKGERMLDGILSTMANGVIMADETSTIVRVNAAALRMFGYEEAEMLGQNISIIMPSDFALKHAAAVERYFQTGRGQVLGTCGNRATAKHKDGTLIDVSLGLSGCVFPDGSRVFTAIFHDIRPENKAQAAETTRKVADAQLETQQQFTQYLFHVLRNPLNSATKGVELMAQALVSPKLGSEDRCAAAQMEIQHIANSMAQTLHIMDNLLDIYNLQSGKEFLAHVPFSLKYQLTHTSECLRHLLNEGVGMDVTCIHSDGKSFSDEDVQLLGSPYHLQQVLANLLLNATQHTKDGTIQLAAIVKSQTEADVTLQIQVADTGSGITPEKRAFVLKLKDSVALRIGTGLGLTIAQNLVKLMGGTLHIQSPWRPGLQQPGQQQQQSPSKESENDSMKVGGKPEQEWKQGTMVYFDLKLKKATDAGTALTRDPLPSNFSVLIVDDLALNRRLWRIIFTSGPFQALKWKIDDVEDGETALQKIMEDGKSYDIVVLDEILGDDKKRGREVAQLLRQWETDNDLPTPMLMIGASGNCTNEDREAALAAGQDLFYGKPYPTAQQIEQDIATILHARFSRQDQQFCVPMDEALRELGQTCSEYLPTSESVACRLATTDLSCSPSEIRQFGLGGSHGSFKTIPSMIRHSVAESASSPTAHETDRHPVPQLPLPPPDISVVSPSPCPAPIPMSARTVTSMADGETSARRPFPVPPLNSARRMSGASSMRSFVSTASSARRFPFVMAEEKRARVLRNRGFLTGGGGGAVGLQRKASGTSAILCSSATMDSLVGGGLSLMSGVQSGAVSVHSTTHSPPHHHQQPQPHTAGSPSSSPGSGAPANPPTQPVVPPLHMQLLQPGRRMGASITPRSGQRILATSSSTVNH